MNGSLTIDCGPDLITVTGWGMWAPDHVDAHFAKLAEAISGRRALRGRVCILVDLHAAAVQCAESAERVREWTSHIYREADRVAIILASELLKSQMKRCAPIEGRAFFASQGDARAWLTEVATPSANVVPR